MNVIANGVVGNFTVTASLANQVASAGFQLTNAANRCHVTANGSIGVADVQAMVNQALGATVPANDLTGDGVVNVVDVQIAMNAALQLGCSGM